MSELRIEDGYHPGEEFFTGYAILEENRQLIQRTAQSFTVSYEEFAVPEEIDPRNHVRHDQQGGVGSCQGFSLTNCGEYLRLIAERDSAYSNAKQFSAMFAYLETQRVDNLIGRDVGSTISGGLRIAREVGFCPDELLPYVARYPANARTLITQAMRQAASPFKIRSHAWLRSYDDVFRYLASGVGAVHTGTVWNQSFYTQPNQPLERVSLSNGGGHATAWLGYSKRKDSRGRNYIWRLNSHNDSWTEMAPSVIDQLFSHSHTSVVGISDLSTPRPRKVDFTKQSVFG
jgi:hypothetical protein